MFEDINKKLSKLTEAERTSLEELEVIYNEIIKLITMVIGNIKLQDESKLSKMSVIFSKLAGVVIKTNTDNINSFMRYYNNTKDVLVDIRKELQTMVGFNGR